MQVVKITKKVYNAVGCECSDKPFLTNFGRYKELREEVGSYVQKTCFNCHCKFKPEDLIWLACFDNGCGNKLLCTECRDLCNKDLGENNIWKGKE